MTSIANPTPQLVSNTADQNAKFSAAWHRNCTGLDVDVDTHVLNLVGVQIEGSAKRWVSRLPARAGALSLLYKTDPPALVTVRVS